MTTSTVEQQKFLYSKQLAAHTIRLWSSVRTVQLMAGYDLKAKQLNESPTPTPNESQSTDQDSDKEDAQEDESTWITRIEKINSIVDGEMAL